MTASGLVDASLAADLDLSVDGLSEGARPTTGITAAQSEAPTPTSAARAHTCVNSNEDVGNTLRQGTVTTDLSLRGARAGGRPKTPRREAIATTATPDGPTLHRDAGLEE
ncbi:unnamed protein product [Phytophthora fragariaefolia]|uniref:Unnamed protein product n=1 Tax=Phytophthora fragariaefolia TaxID=1490495 RepID=A0A9W6XD87_9STRA|nr:unnamed protein product [Phytophthora fragariaefolia]